MKAWFEVVLILSEFALVLDVLVGSPCPSLQPEVIGPGLGPAMGQS